MSYTYRGKGREPKTATRAGEPSLLAYVIAYLQEEVSRVKKADWNPSRAAVKHMVTDAINAYEGGAR